MVYICWVRLWHLKKSEGEIRNCIQNIHRVVPDGWRSGHVLCSYPAHTWFRYHRVNGFSLCFLSPPWQITARYLNVVRRLQLKCDGTRWRTEGEMKGKLANAATCLLRHTTIHFSSNHHFGFEAAAWYWHFVEITTSDLKQQLDTDTS